MQLIRARVGDGTLLCRAPADVAITKPKTRHPMECFPYQHYVEHNLTNTKRSKQCDIHSGTFC